MSESKGTLSQDEINALMEGIDSNMVSTSDDKKNNGEIRQFDFAAQERIVSGRLPGLFAIIERFTRNFRTSLMNLLRRSVEINLSEMDTIKYSDYISRLKAPSCMCVVRIRPLHGSSIVYFNSKLVFRLVDYLFGCSPVYRSVVSDNKEFTQMELRIVHLILNMIFKDSSEAWRPVIPVEFETVGIEFNPQLLNIATQNDILVVMKYKVDIDGEVSEIHQVIPYSMIEPIRSSLEVMGQGEEAEINEYWNNSLKEEVFSAKVSLTGSLCSTKIKMKDLLNIKVNDVLAVDMPDTMTVLAADIPIFKAKFGVSNSRSAIKIIGKVTRD